MGCESAQPRKVSNPLRYASAEVVVVQLEEKQLGKCCDGVNTSFEKVVIKIELLQIDELRNFCGNRARKAIEVKVKEIKLAQSSNTRRNGGR
jgi:hypothetical protein